MTLLGHYERDVQLTKRRYMHTTTAPTVTFITNTSATTTMTATTTKGKGIKATISESVEGGDELN